MGSRWNLCLFQAHARASTPGGASSPAPTLALLLALPSVDATRWHPYPLRLSLQTPWMQGLLLHSLTSDRHVGSW